MTRILLSTAAASAIIAIVCFSALHALGGVGSAFGHEGHRRFAVMADGDYGPPATRDLPWVGGADLSVDYPAHITYTQGPVARITVSGPKGVVDAMSMDGGQLVSPDQHWGFMRHGRSMTITVTSPSTHGFHLSGAEDLTIENFDQDSLELRLSGTSHVRASGRARHMTAQMSGAGDLDMANMPIQDAEVRISGAGSATIDPKLAADISISGAGAVHLLTRPPTLHSRISGVGNISGP